MPRPFPFKVLPNLLPPNNHRYKKWKESLKKRPPSWLKGKTKETDKRVKKISDTFKRKKIDNFAKWREQARKEGLIPASYTAFKKDENLAFLIGLTLGDGSIYQFPRTEKLTIALGTKWPDLISHTFSIVEKIFKKRPNIHKPKGVRMVRITIYEKLISKRLGIPAGNRRYSTVGIPNWAWRTRKHLIACLKGLYEAEASLNIHMPTSTYNFAFHNKNEKLLKDVEEALRMLKVHPEIRSDAIRLRKKDEVKYFADLINFRRYNAG